MLTLTLQAKSTNERKKDKGKDKGKGKGKGKGDKGADIANIYPVVCKALDKLDVDVSLYSCC